MIGFEVHPAAAHSAAKGAVIGLTHQLAVEGRHHGVRVNTISPGLIETNQSGPLLQDPAWAGPMLAKIMLNRLGRPEEVANAAVFLASDESSYVTGANIVVTGLRMTMKLAMLYMTSFIHAVRKAVPWPHSCHRLSQDEP